MDGIADGAGLLDILKQGVSGYFGYKTTQAQAKAAQQSISVMTQSDAADAARTDALVKYITVAVVLGGIAALIVRKR